MHDKVTKLGLGIIAAVALLGIGVVGVSVAPRIFTRASSPYAPVEPPVVDATDKTAMVTWESGQAADVVVVKYKDTPDNVDTAGIPKFDSTPSKTHSVKIDGLKEDTTYYFVIGVGAEVFMDKGQPYQFKTKPSTGPKKEYPNCKESLFKDHYGAAKGDPRYDPLFDVNEDGVINAVDFFECLKGNPQ